MSQLRMLVMGTAITLGLAACMHNGYDEANGDVTVDSLSAARTAILRIQNAHSSEVRIYAVIDGHLNYVAKAMPGETRMIALDPYLVPASALSFEARPADDSQSGRVGPYKVEKGETVELVVPQSVAQLRATVHPSAR